MSREKTIKVQCVNQAETHFADLDLPELPRKDDIIEIGFPNQQAVKSFTIWRVVWRMVPLPQYEMRLYDGIPVECRNDPPWRWEIQLHGYLYDPTEAAPSGG